MGGTDIDGVSWRQSIPRGRIKANKGPLQAPGHSLETIGLNNDICNGMQTKVYVISIMHKQIYNYTVAQCPISSITLWAHVRIIINMQNLQ